MNIEIISIDHASIFKATICKTELTFSVKIDSVQKAAVFIRHIFNNKFDALFEFFVAGENNNSLQFGGFHN